MANDDPIIEHPTFLEHIKFFFEPLDIDHMGRRGMDLATYEGVRSHATSIYAQTKSGTMPPEPDRRWSSNRVRTFRNWIVSGYPMGVAPRPTATQMTLSGTGGMPLRKDAESLSKQEIARLSLAFSELMKREPDDAQSYFALADIHWYPQPINCLHHEPRYNPWHRVYIDRFEKALQSVPGCEDIALPYWNVVSEPPKWMFQPPFDSYTLQKDATALYPAGTKTERHSAKTIHKNIVARNVEATIRDAMDMPKFLSFTNEIERAHDHGHMSCGTTMESTDIASFDPIFWFFHCNWERLWWAWQKRYNAMTLETFRQTLDNEDTEWLDMAPLNSLPPFEETADKTIDAIKYRYEDAGTNFFSTFARVEAGHIAANQRFSIPRKSKLSIRVKDIQRLAIPGSFDVHLLANGETVAMEGFFQGTKPSQCPNCVKREKVSIDFKVNRTDIAGKDLEVRIEAIGRKGKDRWIPLSEVGSPTINIRELLTAT